MNTQLKTDVSADIAIFFVSYNEAFQLYLCLFDGYERHLLIFLRETNQLQMVHLDLR